MADYKNTLNILKTNFEMKGNLNKKEPIIQNKWVEQKIYHRLLEMNKNNKQWILHDGPPYANGDIHVGHALNKIIKDIIVRYKLMNRYYAPFIPGWDTHGLPIEHALEKKNDKLYKTLSTTEKRNKCKVFASENVNKQIEQFERLGLIFDLKNNYLTMYPWFEYNQLNLFLSMVKKHLVFQDFKPVWWSWSSQSALAEAEIEYKLMESDSIYLTFKIVEKNKFLDVNDKLIVWTTTPWTLPSNLAIAVHPDYEYVKISYKNENFILLNSLLKKLTSLLKWNNFTIISKFKGSDIENTLYKHPWINRVSKIILANFVTNEDGTGLVHIAPGFGPDDFIACKKYGINVYCPIDPYGKFDKSINDNELIGVFYEKSNQIIIDRLKTQNSLLISAKITHSAAIDWRTKKPIIYRATKQWFINIEKIKNELNKSIETVNFFNENNKKQLKSMISNRKEWCISRQRIWGVPIPIIFDENNKPIFDIELMTNIIELIKKYGIDSWFEKPVDFFLTKKYLSSISYKKFTKEKDIMDVWFDSGSSYNVITFNKLELPSDLYFEGSDQFRGWFNSSLICSVIQNSYAPYKSLLSHGFVLDEQGRKMSKSLGNVIDPNVVCNEYGADILRLWAANTNFQQDVRISKNILLQTAEIYRRIRNSIFKFILSNISDFEFNNDDSSYYFDEIDQYILFTLKNNLKEIVNAYEKYEFSNVIKIINLHAIQLSSWYFDIIKDCLYCDKRNDKHRLGIQTVLYTILKTYLISLAPIIPHTCEEAYQCLKDKKESIFFEKFTDKIGFDNLNVNENYFHNFFKIKDKVYSKLEILKLNGTISKNTMAKVNIKFNNKFNFSENNLKKYLNVACVLIENDSTMDENEFVIECSNSNYKRCERCWNYYEEGKLSTDNLCHRCKRVLE